MPARSLPSASLNISQLVGPDAQPPRGLAVVLPAQVVQQSRDAAKDPDAVSNFDLTEALDQRIGTTAAHAVRNVPVATPEKRVGGVLDGMRGSIFDSAVVWPCAPTGAWWPRPNERPLMASADAVMADVMDNDPPLVCPLSPTGWRTARWRPWL